MPFTVSVPGRLTGGEPLELLERDSPVAIRIDQIEETPERLLRLLARDDAVTVLVVS